MNHDAASRVTPVAPLLQGVRGLTDARVPRSGHGRRGTGLLSKAGG
ncbi:hypothetical protein ACH437_23775 [Streptomyces xinghaiensis]